MNINVIQIHEGAVMEIHSPAALQRANFPPEYIADIQNDYQGTSPYHVNYCGYQQCEPGHKAGPYKRTSYLIHVVTEGAGIYKLRGKTYPVHEGQLFVIFPGEVTTYKADRKTPWEYAWVGFSGYRIPQILSYLGVSVENPVLTIGNAKELMSVILRMMSACRMTLSDELFRTAELLRFFGIIMEGMNAEHPMSHIYSRETYAQVALRYLNDNYMYKISIADLAAAIGVERSYLSRVFLSEYHLPPQQYLLRLRMEKACEMLEKSDLTVSEISERVGYDDIRSFTKAFRKLHGVSPSVYKKAIRSDSKSG